MPDADEPELIRRLKRRDEAAFNELVRQYQQQVFRLVLRMLGEQGEAEDVAQEVFITVFKSIDRFRGDAKLSTWLYRVAANHCKNRLKYLQRRAHGAKRELDEHADGKAAQGASVRTTAQVPRPDDMAQGRQTEGLVQRALRELGAEQRELIVLRDIENLSYEDIREVTGLAEGTVKSRLHRARLALQQRLHALQGSPASDRPPPNAPGETEP